MYIINKKAFKHWYTVYDSKNHFRFFINDNGILEVTTYFKKLRKNFTGQ